MRKYAFLWLLLSTILFYQCEKEADTKLQFKFLILDKYDHTPIPNVEAWLYKKRRDDPSQTYGEIITRQIRSNQQGVMEWILDVDTNYYYPVFFSSYFNSHSEERGFIPPLAGVIDDTVYMYPHTHIQFRLRNFQLIDTVKAELRFRTPSSFHFNRTPSYPRRHFDNPTNIAPFMGLVIGPGNVEIKYQAYTNGAWGPFITDSIWVDARDTVLYDLVF